MDANLIKYEALARSGIGVHVVSRFGSVIEIGVSIWAKLNTWQRIVAGVVLALSVSPWLVLAVEVSLLWTLLLVALVPLISMVLPVG